MSGQWVLRDRNGRVLATTNTSVEMARKITELRAAGDWTAKWEHWPVQLRRRWWPLRWWRP
jgi:hypothetical protein